MKGLLEVMIDAARRAGAGLMRDFERVRELSIREKGASDFVSNADLTSQALIADQLVQSFPDACLVLEEDTASHGLRGVTEFFVDPLDGTTNFLHGIPHFSVSIACQRDGVLVAGVVFDVPKHELFAAERGKGAWLGERRLSVSRETSLERSVIGTGVPHRGRPAHERYLAVLPRMMGDVAGIRRMGSAALDLAYVAAGRFEAFYETHLSPWDIAAGVVLVREAGGNVVQPNGAPFELTAGHVLAAPEALLEPLAERLGALV
ncbi:MAG: inositol monophosphatase family protein [Polyangiaceae bacterium]